MKIICLRYADTCTAGYTIVYTFKLESISEKGKKCEYKLDCVTCNCHKTHFN